MPEAFPNPFVRKWVMIHLLKKPSKSERIACKVFAATGQFGGTNIRASQTGSGLCSLHFIHRSSTLLPCVVSTLLRTVTSTTPSHQSNLTAIPSRPLLITLTNKKDSLFLLRRNESNMRRNPKHSLLKALKVSQAHRSLRSAS